MEVKLLHGLARQLEWVARQSPKEAAGHRTDSGPGYETGRYT
jgi:hypothetical protein